MPSTNRILKDLFTTRGRAASLVKPDGKADFYAFLQPLRYKNKQYIGGSVTELRYDTARKFLLISPACPDVSIADGTDSYIVIDGMNYCIDHSEEVYFGKELMYRWSVVHISHGGKA